MKPIFNRLLSGMVSATMTISAIPIVSVHAEESPEKYPYTLFAASHDEGAITINANTACVNGNIATNGTIVSSGNLNVNGTKTENADESMMIIFNKIDTKWFSDNAVDEYEVNYTIEQTNIHIRIPTEVQGEASLLGNIDLSTAFKALDDISFSGNVANANNAVIFSQYGDIVIDSQNVNLNGLIYAPNGCVDITAQNLNMNNVVVIADSIVINCPNLNANYGSNVAEFVGTTSEKAPDTGKFIILSGEYDEDDETIDMTWFTNIPADEYEIYSSDDGKNYSLVDTIDETDYQYDIEDDFDVRYFKVTATDEDGSVVESDPFTVIATEDGYSIKFVDKDGDGLQDSVEKIYGTDPSNPDTDGDNLTDGFEVLKSHTNPNSVDTDENGITDDLEDSDEDGLNNYEEMLHETDPQAADTEGDGLNDGDEVKVYGTDPLEPDTDHDGILDSDEVNFELDPKDPTDYDTPVHQVLDSKDLRVNRYNSDFSISLDVEASNNVKRFLKQESSRYSSILLENRAIVGRPINLKYEAGTIYSGTMKFTLSEKLVKENPSYYPELGIGIERYGLFVYDEEIGTIVPLSCNYNTEDNSFTVDATAMGNLMIIDYEALLYDLGITPDEVRNAIESYTGDVDSDEEEEDIDDEKDNDDEEDVEDEETVEDELDIDEDSIVSDDESIASEDEFFGGEVARKVYLGGATTPEDEPVTSSGPRQIELVLVIDTTGSMGGQMYTVKTNLINLINKLRDDGITQYTAVITYGDIDYNEKTLLNNEENPSIQFISNPSQIQSVINNMTNYWGGDVLETAIDGLGLAESLQYSSNRSRYLFLITDVGSKTRNNYGFTDMNDIATALSDKGIYASVVTGQNYFSSYKDLTEITGGIEILQNGNFCDDMYEFIMRNTPKVSVIVANNLVTGCFKEELVKDGKCNTDGDKLSDSEEINWKYIDDKHGPYIYPKWSELCQKSGYEESKNSPFYDLLKDKEVIPASSNPFSRDTDDDGIIDGDDDNPLSKDPRPIDDDAIDDTDENNIGNTLSYELSPNEIYTFTLKPKHDSFYIFDTKAVISSIQDNTSLVHNRIDISHEEGWGLWKETVDDEPTSYGHYLLKKGVTYTIEVFGTNNGKYNFTVRQDNWYNIPNEGGIAYVDWIIRGDIMIKDYTLLYIPESKISELVSTMKFDNKSDPYFNQDFISAMEHRFFVDKKTAEVFIDKASNAVSIFTTFVGVVITIIAPEITVPETIAAGVTYVGGTATAFNLLCTTDSNTKNAFLSTLKDATKDGNYNLCLNRYSSVDPYARNKEEIYLNWESWDSMYVNKFYKNTIVSFTPGIEINDIPLD